MSTPTHNSIGTTSVSAAGLGDAAALVGGRKWGGSAGTGVALTFSFPAGPTSFVSNYGDYANTSQDGGTGAGEFHSFYSLYSGEQNAVRSALALWSGIGGIAFSEVDDNANVVGDLRFALTDVGGPNTAAHAYLPSKNPEAGDVWFMNGTWHTAGKIAKGSYDWLTILHEVGHALGLKHPFEGANRLPAAYDNYNFTIMSYSAYAGGNGDNGASFYPTTPMYYDIVAMQFLYGAARHNHGDTVYAYTSGKHYWETIDDSGGTDTISYDGADKCTIDLRQGDWSDLGLPIFFDHAPSQSDTVMMGPRSVIENARGGDGDDVLTGNGGANILRGGGGKDKLIGGKGKDTLNGEAGFDSLNGGAGPDHFAFKIAPAADLDTILDFSVADDTIDLARAVFSGLGPAGVLKASRFHIGAGAADSSDRIIYDKNTGGLFFDPDGAGGTKKELFAVLDAGLDPTNADFLVI